jgi:hypothetical protein
MLSYVGIANDADDLDVQLRPGVAVHPDVFSQRQAIFEEFARELLVYDAHLHTRLSARARVGP